MAGFMFASPRSETSPYTLLPPIVSSEKDKYFLIGLNSFVEEELGKVKDRYNPEQRFAVYRSAFNQVRYTNFVYFWQQYCIKVYFEVFSYFHLRLLIM